MADELEKLGEESLNSWKKVGEEIMKSLPTLDNILDTTLRIHNAAKEVSKQFGIGNERIQEMKVGMSNAIVEVLKLGGEFKNIVEIQKGVADSLGRNVVLSSDLYGKLYAASEVTGESAKDIVSSFRDVGISSFQAVEGIKKVVDVSKEQGVSAQKVSSQVLNNMDNMNKFTFQGGVEGLAKMAAQAVGLRVNMKETLALSEGLLQPEKAIEMAASLQRLGVAQSDLLDPLRLMDLAQNDPTELQNQIVQMTQQFVHLNAAGQFEILPGGRRQLMEISKEIGISYDQLTKMALGSSELDRKMREMDFGGRFSEEDRKMIANMSEMGKGGEYVITTKEGKEKKITELDDKDIEYLTQATKDSTKSLEQIQVEQLSFLREISSNIKASLQGPLYGAASVASGTKLMTTIGEKAREFGEGVLQKPALKPESIRDEFDKTINILNDGFSNFFKTGNFSELTMSIGKAEQEIRKFGNEVGRQVGGGLVASIEQMAKTTNLFNIMGNLIRVGSSKNMEQSTSTVSKTINSKDMIVESPTKIPTNIKPNDMTTDSSLTMPKQIPVKDSIVINTLPEDSVREVNGLAIGTNLNGTMMGEQKITGGVDVNLNISLTSTNTNLSSNDIINAIRNGEVQQELIASITDAINNGIKGNVNPQLNPYSKNPLLNV